MKKYATKILLCLGAIFIICIALQTPYMIDARNKETAHWDKEEKIRRNEWFKEHEKEYLEYKESLKETPTDSIQ